MLFKNLNFARKTVKINFFPKIQNLSRGMATRNLCLQFEQNWSIDEEKKVADDDNDDDGRQGDCTRSTYASIS